MILIILQQSAVFAKYLSNVTEKGDQKIFSTTILHSPLKINHPKKYNEAKIKDEKRNKEKIEEKII